MKISVIVPAYNEEQNLPILQARLSSALEACLCEHEIIYVNDGSRDETLRVLRELASADPRVKYLSLSRNFGHEVAVAAGLDRAEGDAVALIDADLQDPPELIKDMVERWRAGADVVYAQRRKRRDPLPKKIAIYLFYRVLKRISEVDIPLDTGNFRVMDRRVVEAVKTCRENPRFIRGLVSWVGFKQEAFLYDRHERHAGETGYGFRKLVKLALDGVCSFSLAPLRLTTWLGALVILLSVLLTVAVVADKIRDPNVPRGFAFLACVVLFMGGVQLFMLGMLAQYTGYVLKNVQGRPMYLIGEEGGWPRADESTDHQERPGSPVVVVRRTPEGRDGHPVTLPSGPGHG
jgi:dolichol-phosphate mannosyltransferase